MTVNYSGDKLQGTNLEINLRGAGGAAGGNFGAGDQGEILEQEKEVASLPVSDTAMQYREK